MIVHSRETEHYENFPVASWLCPARLRPAIGAIYAFARTADDLADEGDAPPERRLADLQAFRADLLALLEARALSSRWPEVFERLRPVMAEFGLPPSLLLDLLSAFEQDVVKTTYADRAELLEYCSRSANPIGRLLLHLYGVEDESALAQSDAICSALQLANFWQDLSVDLPRRRYYVPIEECRCAGVAFSDMAAQLDSPDLRAMVQALVQWTRTLMLQGTDLPEILQARCGWRIGMELRLVMQGGLRILDKIEAMNFDSLRQRPKLGASDVIPLVWRALWMRPRALHRLQGAA
jgi:squalene synthase HpnC